MLLVAAIATAGVAQAPPAFDGGRLSTTRMEELVAAPVAAVRAGKWDKAVAMLEADRARVAGQAAAITCADLDESFGVLVYTEGLTGGPSRLKADALPFLERAVGSYRAALGDRHPEVALALQSWADVLIALDRAGNAPRARQAYCEAFRIRFAALGPTDKNTGAALAEVLRLAPAGTADADTMRQIERTSPRLGKVPKSKDEGLLSLLTAFRTRFADDRARQDRAYETLATDPRYVALCPLGEPATPPRP